MNILYKKLLQKLPEPIRNEIKYGSKIGKKYDNKLKITISKIFTEEDAINEMKNEIDYLTKYTEIPGFNNYKISKTGEIYSLFSERILKPQENHKGYFDVVLMKNGDRNYKKVHRLVAKTFIPNPENKSQVNHIDGDKENNSVNNLEWCTCAENIRHYYNNNYIPTTEPSG